MIEFGEWLPDIAAYGNPGSTEAKNVIPTVDGFDQMNALSTTSSALNLYCRGAFAAQSSAKLSFNYAGSGTKLYQLVDGVWTDQSKASGTYAVSAKDSWEFVKWGEKIIVVGGINTGTPVPPQIITLGAVGSTEFADLGGSPPQARHIGVVRDFILMGNLYESATLYPNRVRWCGVNNETEWTTDPRTQADFQDLQGDGGWIQSIKGGQYGIIIQERSVWRQDYMGPPIIFSFNEILPGVGTPAPNSVIQYGNNIFFLSQTGFVALQNGQSLMHIGENKIDRWVLSAFDENEASRMVGAIDLKNKMLMWIFPSTGNASGLPNAGVIFDMASGKWSRFESEIEYIFNRFGEDYTLEALDSVNASIDALGVSLDSPEWIGGSILLGAFDGAHKSGSFTGSPLVSVLETKESRLSGQARTMVTRVRPEIDIVGTSVTIAPGARDKLTDAVTWGAEASAERDGSHAIRVDSRFHRFRATITGGFKKALGVAVVEGSPSEIY